MKKVFLLAITGIALLTSCNRDIDLYEGPQKVSDAEIKAHMESIFGTSFSPDQDWNMTASGKVTMTINTPEVKDVVKVQILQIQSHTLRDTDTGAKQECQERHITDLWQQRLQRRARS